MKRESSALRSTAAPRQLAFDLAQQRLGRRPTFRLALRGTLRRGPTLGEPPRVRRRPPQRGRLTKHDERLRVDRVAVEAGVWRYLL